MNPSSASSAAGIKTPLSAAKILLRPLPQFSPRARRKASAWDRYQKGYEPPTKNDSNYSKLEGPISRSGLIPNAVPTEYFGGDKWREVISPDGVCCHVTRL